MFVTLTLTAIVAFAAGHDVNVGLQNGGKKVYDQNITASPAIWKQVQTVFVNATEGEVIGRISVTDNRDDKNGEVSITEGGVGKNNVTIVLKSPTIFRGLDFSVDVYTIAEEEYLVSETETSNATINDDTKVNESSQTTEAITETVATNMNSTYKVPEPHNDEEVKVPATAPINPTDITYTSEDGSGDSDLDTVVASALPSSTTSTTSAPLVEDPINPMVLVNEPVKQSVPVMPSGVKTKSYVPIPYAQD